MTRTRVLGAIVTFYKRTGYPPTIRDLMDLTGLKSTSTVHYHLRNLMDEGLIAAEPEKVRTLRVTDEGRKALARIGVRL